MTLRPTLACAAVLACLAPSAHAAPKPAEGPFADNGGFLYHDQTGAWGDSHQKLLEARAERQALRQSVPAPVDVGEIAVIPDNGKIFVEPRPERRFDLPAGAGVRFAPAQSGFHVSSVDQALEPSAGAALPLGDDDTYELALPFTFEFMGLPYTSIHVNSDGNITFGEGDTGTSLRDGARLIGGPPRIAPLLKDLNPEAGGAVRAAVAADRVVVTWDAVPTFGTTRVSTVQASLTREGLVTLAYGAVQEPFAVVGVAEGHDAPPFSELDLSADLPRHVRAGAAFEEFQPAITLDGRRLVLREAARAFYRTHPDHFDHLVVFSEPSQVLEGFALAQSFTQRNATRGLGLPVFDSGFPAPGSELETIVNMNQIGLYWPDEAKLEDPPIKKFQFAPGANYLQGPPGADQISTRARWFGTGPSGSFTVGLHSAMSNLAHEIGHRWMAFVRHRDPATGQPSDLLLDDEGPFSTTGRTGAHWSSWHNTHVPAEQFGGDPRASSMEGNAITDLGASGHSCAVPGHTPFTTEPFELVDGYSELDQYLMGLRAPSDVSPFFYVDDPRLGSSPLSIFFGRNFLAHSALAFCGRRVDVTVDDVRAVEGAREPAFGDEDDMGTGRDVKTMAFLLIVDGDSPKPHTAAINQVDNVRRVWERYHPRATGGRGRFDTRLHPPVH